MPRPLILVTAHTEPQNTEFPDPAISLSLLYNDAILAAGGLPLILPCTANATVISEAVARADGVLLTGGEDVNPRLYCEEPLAPEIAATVVTAIHGRDVTELILVEAVFRQRRPLLAICRGQQILNVALGGDLIADIPLLHPGALSHNCQEQRHQPVHQIHLEPTSRLAAIVGDPTLAVNSTHHQAVGRVAPPLQASGRSPDGIIEALELHPSHADALPFLVSVQFHPERLYAKHPAHARIFSAFIAAASQ
jgi:putative glutamine amidotransferase